MSIVPATQVCAAIAAGTLGLATGLALSYTAILLPTVNGAKVKTADKLALWKGGYDRGVAAIVPLPLACAGLLAYTSWSVRDPTLSQILGASAALSTGHILVTLSMMLPTNRRLMALQKQSTHSAAEGKETDGLVDQWGRFHILRVCCLATATTVAFIGLLRF